jgi:cobalt-zinc-cadmium efflux system outer membrane protein
MLEGPFQLLLVKQAEFDAYQGYLEALRDYWVARTELTRAVGTQLPSGMNIAPETVGPIVVPGFSASSTQHISHDRNAMQSMHDGEHAKMPPYPATSTSSVNRTLVSPHH